MQACNPLAAGGLPGMQELLGAHHWPGGSTTACRQCPRGCSRRCASSRGTACSPPSGNRCPAATPPPAPPRRCLQQLWPSRLPPAVPRRMHWVSLLDLCNTHRKYHAICLGLCRQTTVHPAQHWVVQNNAQEAVFLFLAEFLKMSPPMC